MEEKQPKEGRVEHNDQPSNKHKKIWLDGQSNPDIIKLKDDGNWQAVPKGWKEVDLSGLDLSALLNTIFGNKAKPKGMVMFSHDSPGCVYYWVGGRLIYR